ncbi:MAG: saccharopine dehydrogenase NADP-binding domain-containing protein [Acidobacteriota bacterium]
MTRPVVSIVGGYGATGEVVATELLRLTDCAIRIGGRDRGRAEGLSARLGPRVSGHRMDVFEPSLAAFCAGASVVVNCAGPTARIGPRVAEAAFDQGAHMVDPGGYESVHDAFAGRRDELVRRGLTGLISAGWIPGLSEVFPRYMHTLASQRLVTFDSLELIYGDASAWSTTGTLDQVEHIRRNLFRASGLYRGGRWRRGGLGAASIARLPAPWGRQLAVLHLFPELRGFAESHPQYRRLRSRATLLGVRTLLTMTAVALVGDRRRRRAVRWLQTAFRREAERYGNGGLLTVTIAGRDRSGAPAGCRGLLHDSRHYWLTGVVPAVATAQLLDGTIRAQGVRYLGDAVEPNRFLAQLERAGLQFDTEFDPGPNGAAARAA